MNEPVAYLDLRRRLVRLEAQIHSAIDETLTAGQLVLAAAVDAFEARFAEYCGVAHGIGVASGTDAITVALEALGVGPGDEVITVANTCVPTVAAILATGATPVLVDADPGEWTLDPAHLSAALSERTRAIVPVHLYGYPADMHAIRAFADAHGLVVVEDAAQAHGATVGAARAGSLGDAAAFSFYPTKNLGALGDGGMVLTDRSDVADAVRVRRQHGLRDGRAVSPGRCSRLDELQAAVLLRLLPGLDRDNARRKELADRYLQALDGSRFACQNVAGDRRSAWHLFVISVERREAFRTALAQRGIGTQVHYPYAIQQHPALRETIRAGGLLDQSERLARSVVSLPLYPELTNSEQDRVIDAIIGLTPDYSSHSRSDSEP